MHRGFLSLAALCLGGLLALATSACLRRGTENRFYLLQETQPPLYVRGGLYDPINVQTWAQIIRARRFFETELAPALARHREALSHEEFLKHLTTREDETRFALDVRLQLGDASHEQNIIAALHEALDRFYAENVASGYRAALETHQATYTESERATLREMSSRPHRLVIRTEAVLR